ncbi:amidohydrolase [Streptomyces sp. NPDC014894]|uniref:amidohydrolase n=1 Tax=Streptomyces sp. NPDC014894 TaxID=3364931 RepID=UPI0037018D5D
MTSRLPRRQLLSTAGGLGAAAALTASGTAAATGSGGRRRSAALVVHNARVLTGVRGERPRRAVAVGRDGTVLATGPDAVVRRWAGRDTEVVDAGGATVMSGIVDGHAHPVGAAARSVRPGLDHRALTVPELLETLEGFLAASAAEEPDGWLVVEEWDPVGLLPLGTLPHHRLLAPLATRRPVALVGSDGHNTWANRRALELAGITAATPDPPGGEIVRDPDGSPAGLLKESAQSLVTDLFPAIPGDLLVAAAATGLARAAAQGVTTFLDATATEWELDVYAALSRDGRLPQRIVPALQLESADVRDPRAALDWARGVRARYGAVPGVRFGTVKFFLDGVIEHPAQTAALLDPYLGADGRPTDRRGDLYATAREFAELTALFDRHGWQVHTHAIGDRAVRTALDGYEAVLRAGGRRDARHTVTHLQLVHPDDLPRFARLGVPANMQTQWAMRDLWTVDALLPYIGAERHRRLYPTRSLERAGAVLAGGSDWPVDPLRVWNQIRTAIDREGESATQGPLYPEREGIGRASALRMHTAGAAYQLRLDRRVGTLTPGRAADLIVLDRDVTRVPVREISDTRVRLTLRGGRTVYDADSAAGRAVRAGMEAAARTDAAARTGPGARTGTGPGAGGAAARHAGCAHARGRGDRTAG